MCGICVGAFVEVRRQPKEISSYLLCGFWGLNSWEVCRHVSLLVELSFWNLVYKPGLLQTKESLCVCLLSAGWD